MVRTISASALAGLIPPESLARPFRDRLAARLRLLILDGRLPEGARLPSERELAARLGLSRSTVTSAYADLRDSGQLRARQGSGNFVTARADRRPALDPREVAGSLVMTYTSAPACSGAAEAYAAALERLPVLLGTHGCLPDGLPALREALAGWYERRGLPTDPGQIVITNGALAAINLAARTLLGPGDRVLVESPGYANALDALRQCGARLVPAPMAEVGWDVEQLVAAVRQSAPRAALLIPDFHNPTGASMPADQRSLIASALRRERCIPLIDETLVELDLDGVGPVTPFAVGNHETVSVGSASKAFWGGLRIGWLRAPEKLVPRLLAARAGSDLGAAPLEQQVLVELLQRSDELVSDQRARLRGQRDTLLALLADRLPQWRVQRPAGGQSVWIELPAPLGTPLLVAAAAEGVTLLPGHRFFPAGGGERHLRLPFTATVPVLTEAVDRLARAWARLPHEGDPTPAYDLIA